jgi:hypothetical protein
MSMPIQVADTRQYRRLENAMRSAVMHCTVKQFWSLCERATRMHVNLREIFAITPASPHTYTILQIAALHGQRGRPIVDHICGHLSAEQIHAPFGPTGCSALMIASQRGHIHVMQAILDHVSLDVTATDNEGCTILVQTIACRQLGSLHCLLCHEPQICNMTSACGSSKLEQALYTAARNGQTRIFMECMAHREYPAPTVSALSIAMYRAMVLASESESTGPCMQLLEDILSQYHPDLCNMAAMVLCNVVVDNLSELCYRLLCMYRVQPAAVHADYCDRYRDEDDRSDSSRCTQQEIQQGRVDLYQESQQPSYSSEWIAKALPVRLPPCLQQLIQSYHISSRVSLLEKIIASEDAIHVVRPRRTSKLTVAFAAALRHLRSR